MFEQENMPQACVSVILPCYNVEQYLREALDSVLAQTLTNIEIIPVDDGSPDNCSDIIKEYAKKDPRIKPIFKENGGYGSAVNAGLKIASGEYIAILEPDDYVMEDYYYILYHEAKKDDLDVCGVNAYCEVRDFEPPKLIQTHWIDNPDYMSFENINEYLSFGNVGITLKIYKKDFLEEKNIKLKNNLRAYHDLPFVTEVLLNAKTVRIIIGTGYFYRKDNSISTTKNRNTFFNILNAIDCLLELISKYGKRESRKISILNSCASHLLHYLRRLESFKESSTSIDIKNKLSYIISLGYKLELRETYKRDIIKLFNNSNNIDFVKNNVINFDKCPSFDIDYYRNKKCLSDLLAELSFFTYYAIALNNFKEAVIIRSQIRSVLTYFINLKARFIEDFIKFYFSKGWVNFVKDYNIDWYIIFSHYLKEEPSFKARLYESINHISSENSLIQYMPSFAQEIDKSYYIFNDNLHKSKTIRNFSNKNKDKFFNFIKNKSIAVVGNAPSEKGLYKGEEIDSHDIVIRFNNFSTEKQFERDYGKKTNIWAITPSIENLYFQDNFYDFNFVMVPELNFFLGQERLNIIYNYIVAGGNYFYFDSINCRRFFNMSIPSIGLYFLYYLLGYIKNIKKVSLYGFSPLEAKNEVRHYFLDDPTKTSNLEFHDWDKESIIINKLKDIFNQHNLGEK